MNTIDAPKSECPTESVQVLAIVLCSLVLLSGVPLMYLQNAGAYDRDNSPPSIIVPDYPYGYHGDYRTYTVICNDTDPADQLRLSWFWGDGSVSVTDHASTGGAFEASAVHMFMLPGLYEIRVWIDDLTGLADHDVSDTGSVAVYCIHHSPYIQIFMVDNPNPFVGDTVNFTLLASDAEQWETLVATIDFGDGTSVSSTIVSDVPWTVEHLYPTWGYYDVMATVSDNMTAPDQELNGIEVLPRSFSLNLSAGWNQVTLPLVGWGYTSANLGLSFGSLVVRWNETWQNYSEQFIVGLSPPSWAFPIVPGYGYWIFTPTAKTLTLYGAIPTETQHLYCDFSGLAGGWTMIGFVGLNQDRHASDLPLMYSVPGAVKVVSHWNPWTGMYQSYISEFPMTDFALVPGLAYWVWCTASGYFAYEP